MSTTIAQPPPTDSLALVNGFYGPSATAGWYLTCLACFVSWSLHPRKRKADAITSDLIVLVTYPMVASAHLIVQIFSWPPESSVDDKILEQMRASLNASLVITETYLSVCMILTIPGIFVRAPKRLCLLAVTGTFSVLAETYLYSALPSVRYKPRVSGRSFIIDSFDLVLLMLVLTSVLTGLLLVYIYVLFRRRRRESTTDPQPGSDTNLEDYSRLSNESPQLHGFHIFALSFLIFGLSGSGSAPIVDLLLPIDAIPEKNRTVWSGRRSLVDEFFPRTEASIMDLDQAVEVLLGMATLGFNLYSAADALYKRWLAEESSQGTLE